jgi:CarboxypepD_reg-like domain
MKKHFLLTCMICSVFTTLLSQKTITGTVFNDKNEPLVGANVILKGSTIGAISDIDGKYQINIPSKHYSDTLICSFIGHQSEVLTAKVNTVDFKLNEGLFMQEVIITGYIGCIRRCCGCGGIYRIFQEDWQNPLTPTPLSNGYTKLTYEVDILSKGVYHYLNNRFEDKKVQYQVFKSTDGENFKLIGTSRSDSIRVFKSTFKGAELIFGGSQFLDKSINTADTTYYKVEGYLVDVEDEDGYAEEVRDTQYVYRQTTKVLPVEVLKITNLYAPRQSPQIELSLSTPQEGQADFVVSDMSGRVVLKHQQPLFKQNNTLILPFDDMPSGMYVLSVRQGVQVDSRKFMVVK